MYDAGVAYYIDPVYETVDMVGAIRTKESFDPLLISVKTKFKNLEDENGILRKMLDIVDGAGYNEGLCLLIYFVDDSGKEVDHNERIGVVKT
jgi:hypothetical protein